MCVFIFDSWKKSSSFDPCVRTTPKIHFCPFQFFYEISFRMFTVVFQAHYIRHFRGTLKHLEPIIINNREAVLCIKNGNFRLLWLSGTDFRPEQISYSKEAVKRIDQKGETQELFVYSPFCVASLVVTSSLASVKQSDTIVRWNVQCLKCS